MNKTNLELGLKVKPLEKIVHGLIYLYILMVPFQNLGIKFLGLA